MSSKDKNLSEFNKAKLPDVKNKVFGLVVSEWNTEVTESLYQGAYDCLIEHGVAPENIVRWDVPGSYELPLAASLLADAIQPAAVICIGCVIQGETRHFDFICQSVADGIMQLNLNYKIPFIFGVLTPENQEQALARAGGKYGNKGVEAAVTAIRMTGLKRSSAGN